MTATAAARRPARRLASCALAIVVLGVVPVPRVATAAIDRQAPIDRLVDEVFVPGYERLAAASAAHRSDIGALCVASSTADGPAALAQARDSWAALREAWMLVAPYRFGPAMKRGVASGIDYEIDAGKIDALLAGEGPIDAAALGALGADVRGMGGIEHVLFAGVAPTERGCAYLSGAVAIVDDHLQQVHERWTVADGDDPSFAEQLRDPGSDSMYRTTRGIVSELVNHSVFTLVEIGDRRLGFASGSRTGTPRPELADPGRAQRGAADLAAMLAGVQSVYWGQPANAGEPTVWDVDQLGGLREMVTAMSPGAAARLDTQLADAAALLAELPHPLATAADPAAALAAGEAVAMVLVIYRTELASLLGVTLTFGDGDGDS